MPWASDHFLQVLRVGPKLSRLQLKLLGPYSTEDFPPRQLLVKTFIQLGQSESLSLTVIDHWIPGVLL